MNKKYQVFVSSTYEDLKEERKAVMNCLLDWDCIPVGMEQFPASALSQWDYIKNEIDRSDCYLLIVAGKYGSIDPESGISYTEKEYDYANNKGIPILSFLYEDIGKLNADKVDRDRAQVEKFREKIKAGKRLVDFYSTIGELKYSVALALKNITNGSHGISGVRANEMVTPSLHDFTKLTKETSCMSNEAKMILVEASQDPDGYIIISTTLDGTSFCTNGKTLNNGKTGKSCVIWESAIEELLKRQLIKSNVFEPSVKIYKLTKQGYDSAEIITSV